MTAMPFFLFLGIIVIDQMAKLVIKSNMTLGESIPLVPQIFHFTYVLNPGAAFGILENQRAFFIVAGVCVLLAAAYFYPRMKGKNPWLRYGSMAVLGGAVGNLMGGICIGFVVGFFDLRVWPVFNIADIAIVGGVACMMYAILFKSKEADI